MMQSEEQGAKHHQQQQEQQQAAWANPQLWKYAGADVVSGLASATLVSPIITIIDQYDTILPFPGTHM